MEAVDYLTCGSCQAEFPLSNIVIFMNHKSECLKTTSHNSSISTEEVRYTCYVCPKQFTAAISLLYHAQFQHKQRIFKQTAPLTEREQIRVSEVEESKMISDVLCIEDIKNHKDIVAEGSTLVEPLSKCCTAVVPKKRKRHIETKHRNVLSKSRIKRHQSRPSNIYIDLEQSSQDTDSFNVSSATKVDNQKLYLKPGNTYKIPISGTNNNDFFGISYSDGEKTANDTADSHLQQMIPNSAAENQTKLAPVETKNSNTTECVSSYRKKYPTSKPFQCEYCEQSFNQRIHLKKHLSKHTGVKPYKCGQCDYATVERSHLKVHIRIHTGEKPFKCNHCEYATAQNSTLKIHLKRHHGSLLLECSHCGKSFPEKTQLNKHKQEHNRVEKPNRENVEYHITQPLPDLSGQTNSGKDDS